MTMEQVKHAGERWWYTFCPHAPKCASFLDCNTLKKAQSDEGDSALYCGCDPRVKWVCEQHR